MPLQDGFGPEDDPFGQVHSVLALLLCDRFSGSGVTRLKGIARKQYCLANLRRRRETLLAKTRQKLFEIMHVAKRPTTLEIDCLEGLFSRLLRVKTQVLVKAARGERRARQRQIAFCAG
jgi:hypothetical protein